MSAQKCFFKGQILRRESFCKGQISFPSRGFVLLFWQKKIMEDWNDVSGQTWCFTYRGDSWGRWRDLNWLASKRGRDLQNPGRGNNSLQQFLLFVALQLQRPFSNADSVQIEHFSSLQHRGIPNHSTFKLRSLTQLLWFRFQNPNRLKSMTRFMTQSPFLDTFKFY